MLASAIIPRSKARQQGKRRSELAATDGTRRLLNAGMGHTPQIMVWLDTVVMILVEYMIQAKGFRTKRDWTRTSAYAAMRKALYEVYGDGGIVGDVGTKLLSLVFRY